MLTSITSGLEREANFPFFPISFIQEECTTFPLFPVFLVSIPMNISFFPSLEEKKSWVWWSFLFQSQMMCACRQHPLITLVALMFTCAPEFPGKWVKTQSSRFRRHREGFGYLYFYQVPGRLQCIPKWRTSVSSSWITHDFLPPRQGREGGVGLTP